MKSGTEFLKIASVIFKVLAWVSAAFFLIVSLIVLFGGGGVDTPRAASLIFLLGGGFYFFVLYCVSEIIKLLLFLANKIDRLALGEDRKS